MEASSPGKLRQGVMAFVNLLVRLCDLFVVFPAHWVSDYVQNTLADKDVTRVISAGELPIPVSGTHSSQQGADQKFGYRGSRSWSPF